MKKTGFETLIWHESIQCFEALDRQYPFVVKECWLYEQLEQWLMENNFNYRIEDVEMDMLGETLKSSHILITETDEQNLHVIDKYLNGILTLAENATFQIDEEWEQKHFEIYWETWGISDLIQAIAFKLTDIDSLYAKADYYIKESWDFLEDLWHDFCLTHTPYSEFFQGEFLLYTDNFFEKYQDLLLSYYVGDNSIKEQFYAVRNSQQLTLI